MSVAIEKVEDQSSRSAFTDFYETAYSYRAAHWPANAFLEQSLLSGQTPLTEGKPFRAFLARSDGTIVARCVALVDTNYLRRWNDRTGHLILFEALPGFDLAVCRMVDEACAFLSEHGMEAVRAGYGLLDTPFVIDQYEALPALNMRQNPPFYHSLLKNAGFQTEQGWVDYKMAVDDQMFALGEALRLRTLESGFDLRRFAEIEREQLVNDLTEIRNDTFQSHWGTSPETREEVRFLLGTYEAIGVLETSILAYKQGTVVGMAIAAPEVSALAVLKPGRVLAPDEKLNFLLFGVRESERHSGLHFGLSANIYLDLARKGARYLNGTMVLDDNWPSRRSAERAGLSVWASYITYRRNIRSTK